MTLKFEKFSGPQEQTITRDWNRMVAMSARALGAGVGAAINTWFCGTDQALLNRNMRKMDKVISDAGRTFTFVNRAGGALKVEYRSLLNPNLLPEGSPGNALVQRDFFGNMSGAIAYAFPVNRMGDVPNATTLNDLDDLETSSHVGSGMLLYLTEIYFTLTDAGRAATLYHELTHKVLACEDFAYDNDCLALAVNQKLRNADNYAMFLKAI